MSGIEALQSVQFVSKRGKRSAVISAEELGVSRRVA
jgi:hypothetical protein